MSQQIDEFYMREAIVEAQKVVPYSLLPYS